MYGGDFLFNVSREFVSKCQTPLLVLLGNDLHHPAETSRELAALAPNATLIEHWKEPEHNRRRSRRSSAFWLSTRRVNDGRPSNPSRPVAPLPRADCGVGGSAIEKAAGVPRLQDFRFEQALGQALQVVTAPR